MEIRISIISKILIYPIMLLIENNSRKGTTMRLQLDTLTDIDVLIASDLIYAWQKVSWSFLAIFKLFSTKKTGYEPMEQPTDGPKVGPTDGWTDQPTDGLTDRRTRPLLEMRSRI